MKKLHEMYLRHPYLFIIICYIIYTSLFFLIDNWPRENPTLLHSRIDDWIPFNRFAIFFYAAWFPFLALPLLVQLLRHAYEDVWHLIVPMFTCMFVSLGIYVFWYNGLNLRPGEITQNDFAARIVKAIQQIDTPTNVCPSIHVSSTVIIDLALQRSSMFKERKGWRIFFRFLDIAICISTMVLKQHSIIDVLAGLALALVVDWLWQRYFSKQEAVQA